MRGTDSNKPAFLRIGTADTSRRASFGATEIAAGYVAIALVWILLSDSVTHWLAAGFANEVVFQTLKGSFFVISTGVMLWFLIRRHVRRLEEMNKSLELNESRLRELLDDAPVAICVLKSGVFVYANRAAELLLGDASDLQGRAFLSLLGQDRRSDVADMLERVEKHAKREGLSDQRITGRGDVELDVELAACPFAADPGAVQLAIVDVTQRRRLEAGLRQAHKMEAVGMLAAGVAHEFNNLLTAIMGSAALAKTAIPPENQARRSLEGIEAAGRHAAGITRSLLSLTRPSPALRRETSLAVILAGARELIRGLLPQTVKLTIDAPGAESQMLMADPAQLKQVLLNLAINARDAMPRGGDLVIAAREHSDSPGADGRTRHCVEITVTDSGVGIAPDVLPRLFQPFFSTKPLGKGTGLGLAMARAIVEDHQGEITVRSVVGRGSVFTIRLPSVVALDGVASADHSLAQPANIGRGQLVVLGEDSDEVRRVVAEGLRTAGFRVVEAADGPAVVRAVLEAGGDSRSRAAALVVDVGLPIQSGVECLALVRREYPRIPVIIVTGGSMPDVAPELNERVELLPKPFDVDDLARRLAAMIDASEPVAL